MYRPDQNRHQPSPLDWCRPVSLVHFHAGQMESDSGVDSRPHPYCSIEVDRKKPLRYPAMPERTHHTPDSFATLCFACPCSVCDIQPGSRVALRATHARKCVL